MHLGKDLSELGVRQTQAEWAVSVNWAVRRGSLKWETMHITQRFAAEPLSEDVEIQKEGSVCVVLTERKLQLFWRRLVSLTELFL